MRLEAARTARVPLLGVVENMVGYRCGELPCETGRSSQGDAGERLSRDAGAPLFARIPFDPALQSLVDRGDVAGAAKALGPAADALVGAARAVRRPAGRQEPRA